MVGEAYESHLYEERQIAGAGDLICTIAFKRGGPSVEAGRGVVEEARVCSYIVDRSRRLQINLHVHLNPPGPLSDSLYDH